MGLEGMDQKPQVSHNDSSDSGSGLAWLMTAYGLDLLLGDPERLPHPVRVMGWTIVRLEKWLRSRCCSDRDLHRAGWILLVLLALGSWCTGRLLIGLAGRYGPIAKFATKVWLAYTCLAARSLGQEAGAVASALESGDLEMARNRVGRIVGRDTEALSESEVARAAIETVAENSIDGVMAPLFFLALGGPSAGLAFKAVSTLDSMVGYRDARYLYLGRASARCDDWLNFLPARWGAFILFPLASRLLKLDWRSCLRVVWRDRLKHPSPNSAHGEAAMAGALGISLSGASSYRGKPSHKPVLGTGPTPEIKHVRQAIELMHVASLLGLSTLVLLRFMKRLLKPATG